MKCTTLLLALLILHPCLADANNSGGVTKRRGPLLPEGASPNQVRLLWGDPIEKSVREVKGETVWRYGETVLIFRHGRLVSSSENSTSTHVGSLEESTQSPTHPARMHVLPPQIIPPSAVFREIMEVYGEEGGAPPAAPTPFGMPGQIGGREMPVMPMQLQGGEEMEKGPMIE